MENSNRRYFKSLEEYKQPESVQSKEFSSETPGKNVIDEGDFDLKSSRRDFLKFMGFSVSAATLAACTKTPVKKAIPYVIKPDEVDPGIPNYYATFNGRENYGLLVKTREGRPIKIEGNKLCPISRGGTTAAGQASIISLYDEGRLHGPRIAGKDASWDDVDREMIKGLRSIKGKGEIAILSGTINSPSTLRAIEKFKSEFPGTNLYQYDPVSYSALRKAHGQALNREVLPQFKFNKAKTIVSVNADFLGTWISPVSFTRQYAEVRDVTAGDSMAYHVQFESKLSLTGSKADMRIPTKPSEQGAVLVAIYNALAKKAGRSGLSKAGKFNKYVSQRRIDHIAEELWATRKEGSLVVCGNNDLNQQLLCIEINNMLGAYGHAIDLEHHSNQFLGDEAGVDQLISDMKSGRVKALMIYGSNPVYNHPNGKAFADAMQKVDMTVAFNERLDETAMHAGINAPDNHFLESWNDHNPIAGQYNLSQPTINPIYDTRQAQESLLRWSRNNMPFYDFIRETWTNSTFNAQSSYTTFDDFWKNSLHDGVAIIEGGNESTSGTDSTAHADTTHVATAFTGTALSTNIDLTTVSSGLIAQKNNASGFELSLYQEAGTLDGSDANNPWLIEMPDAVTKVSWDNYLMMSPVQAEELGYSDGDLVSVSAGGVLLENVPVLLVPGQLSGTFGLALGWGHQMEENAARVTNGKGINAFPLVQASRSGFSYDVSGVSIEKTGSGYELAKTQTHHHIQIPSGPKTKDKRITTQRKSDIVKETSLGTLVAYREEHGNEHGAHARHEENGHGHGEEGNGKVYEEAEPGAYKDLNIYPDWRDTANYYKAIHWGMTVNLNTCTGCNACVIACQSENNIPVVGKKEVMNRREMHWIRIDRYFATPERKEEDRSIVYTDNPSVMFQPLMCQHCDNAPCENVCPVNAINHSSEGINQQIYNRCMGTRYCANNCPYKVRRFNWFAYYDNEDFNYNFTMNSGVGRMVLNPDVTVRARGVMEKCSFCMQRIQSAKVKAKGENRGLKDGDVVTACQDACPAGAITFGNMNDPKSKVSKVIEGDLSYRLVELLNTQNSVYYTTQIRNVKYDEDLALLLGDEEEAHTEEAHS